MVKDHSDNKRKPTAVNTRATGIKLAARIFYMHHPTDIEQHTTALLHQLWSTGWNEN